MKINHNCIEYNFSAHFSVWEIETNDAYEYYVEIKGYPLVFSFGVAKDDTREDEKGLWELLKNDYFRPFMEDAVDDINDVDQIYNELGISSVNVCCTGSSFWEAYAIIKGKLYVISNECPQNLMVYEYANRKEEELYMPEDMILDSHNSDLSASRKKIYDRLHSEFIAKAEEWGFNPNLYEEEE